MLWKGGRYPSPPQGHPAYAQPLSPWRQVPASMAFVTDSNRPQPLRQPPRLTASGTAFEAPPLPMHPCPPPPPRSRAIFFSPSVLTAVGPWVVPFLFGF